MTGLSDRNSILAALALASMLTSCATGPLLIEGRGDGWIDGELDSCWRRGSVTVEAPRAFEFSKYPFAGEIRCPGPVVVVFRSSSPNLAHTVVGQWVADFHDPDSRSPIVDGQFYVLDDPVVEGSSVQGRFRLRRTDGEADESWVAPGYEAHYEIEIAGPFGTEVCDFHVEVEEGSAVPELRWYHWILAILVFPIWLIGWIAGGFSLPK